MNLDQGIGRGLRWSIFGTGGAALCQLVTIYIMARLIPVYDFGIMSLIQTLLGFGYFFTDAGLSNALIIQKSISDDQYRTFWYLSISIGICFCMIFGGLAWVFIYIGYTNSQYWISCCLAGLILFLQCTGSIHKSILKKTLQFKVLNIIELLSVLTSSIVSVSLAYYGMGIYALLALPLTNAIISTTLLLWNGRFAFGRIGSIDHYTITHWWRFAMYQISDRVISFLNSRSDTIVIAHYLGLESLGIYEVLKQVIVRPLILISTFFGPVMLPFMSNFSNDTNQSRQTYHRLLRWSVMLSFPMYVLIGVLSPSLCHIYLGAAWANQGHLLAIMAGTYLITSTAIFSMIPAITNANARLSFYWNLGFATFNIIILSLTAPFGLAWIALALCLIQCCLVMPTYLILIKPYLHSKIAPYFGLMLPPLLFSLITGCLVWIPVHLDYVQEWPQLLIVGSLGLVIYAMLNRIFNATHWKGLTSLFFKLKP